MIWCVLYHGFLVILCVSSKTLAACNWGFAGLMVSPQIYSSLASMARVLQIWWERNRFQKKIKVGEIWQVISLIHINVHIYSISGCSFHPKKKNMGLHGDPIDPRLGSRCSPPSKVNQGLIGLERAQACAPFTMPNVGQTFWCEHNHQPSGMVNNYQGWNHELTNSISVSFHFCTDFCIIVTQRIATTWNIWK